MILKQCDLCHRSWPLNDTARWARGQEVMAINYVTRANVRDLCRECREVIKGEAGRAVAEWRRFR